MVDLADIPDFPGMPGQRPPAGEPTDETPVAVVLVTSGLDAAGSATPLNAAAVDAFIAAEIAAGRAHSASVTRWNPWSDLDVQLGLKAASAYNYARFTLPDGSRWYGYLSAEYLNLTTTRYAVAPDDWTTYAPSIGYSFVKRGHVAVAASINDTYGDQYLLEPEPIDARPDFPALLGEAFGEPLSDWTAVVVSANDLRGSGTPRYFQPHILSNAVMAAHEVASQATNTTDGGGPQFDIEQPGFPWVSGGGSGDGGYFWPFPLNTFNTNNGEPEDGFRTAGRPSHDGIDMGYGVANITGTPIRAVKGGEVVFAGFASGYGNRVRIDHGDGYESTYSHMFEAPDVTVGQTVNTGDVLGGIGTTGTSTGNHLHFEIYSQSAGDYIDPIAFMAVQNPDDRIVGDEGGSGSGSTVYVPKVVPAIPSTIDGAPAGGGVFLFSMTGLRNYLAVMQNAPWITDGISSIRFVPSWAVANNGAGGSPESSPPRDPNDPAWATAGGYPSYVLNLNTNTPTQTALTNWRNSALSVIGASAWRKLVTSQFCEVVVSGSSDVSYAPETIRGNDIRFRGIAGSVHGGSTVAVPLDVFSIGGTPPVPLDADGTGTLGASGYGMASAAPNMTEIGFAQLGYGNLYAYTVMVRQRALAIAEAVANAGITLGQQAVQTGVGAAAAGALAGGPAAIAVGAIGLGSSVISSGATMNVLDMKLEESQNIAAYQTGYSSRMAEWSLKTAFQASEGVSGRAGTHTISGWKGSDGESLTVCVRMPSPDRVRAAVSMWERYGYMVGRAFIPPRLDPMTAFSYWQMEDVDVVGSMPADARERIAARFRQGTTVWVNVAQIGTKPANSPRAGIAY